MEYEKPVVCVLDASTYVGFWILKGLLSRGYTVHAAIQRNGKIFFLLVKLSYLLIFLEDPFCGLAYKILNWSSFQL